MTRLPPPAPATMLFVVGDPGRDGTAPASAALARACARRGHAVTVLTPLPTGASAVAEALSATGADVVVADHTATGAFLAAAAAGAIRVSLRSGPIGPTGPTGPTAPEPGDDRADGVERVLLCADRASLPACVEVPTNVRFIGPHGPAPAERGAVEIEALLPRDHLSPQRWLGRRVEVRVDRPLGSRHPDFGWPYPLNYGYVPHTLAGDGEPVDAYVLGPDRPIEGCRGTIVAVIHRADDVEDKLVVSTTARHAAAAEVSALTDFQERWFRTEVHTTT